MNMNRKNIFVSVAVAATLAGALQAGEPVVGLRGGAGTDITGGVAYGGGINRLFPRDGRSLEVGTMVFGGHFEETTQEFYKYEETTDILVVGVLANNLINYGPDITGAFFLAGIGAGAMSVEWEEKSPNDTSLGTPIPGGGSKQSEEATAGGLILNLGLGFSHKARFDLRVETPIFIIAGAPGSASAVVPTLIVTAGIRF